jgi:MOSC domain-containing protein YiiM
MNNRVHVPFAGKSLPSIGVYARVLAGGDIRHGDLISISA